MPNPISNKFACAALVIFTLVLPTSICIESRLAHAETRQIRLLPPTTVTGVRALAKPAFDQQSIQRFRQKLRNISEHHRPIPLDEATRPFSTDPVQKRTRIRARSVKIGDGITIDRQSSVTGSAGIDYYFASPVSEPSVAAGKSNVFVTANWYAARSIDHGKRFEFVDPEKMFGADPVGSGFCCDQLVIYDRKTELFLWYLQGSRTEKGNSIKILVTDEENFEKNQWKSFSISSTDVFGKGNVWLDFPDVALSNEYVYISTNVFSTKRDSPYVGATVFRMPLRDIANYSKLPVDIWIAPISFGSLRFAQSFDNNITYWASHLDTAEIGIFAWADSEPDPSSAHRVNVERWSRPSRENDNIQAADGPNRHPWLDRLDGRITAGWATNSQVGFAWSVGSDKRIKLPHVRVAIIDREKIDSAGEPTIPIEPTAEPHVWSPNFGIAYPSTSVNSAGVVGLSVAFGGKNHFPSHAVGRLAGRQELTGNLHWNLKVSRQGSDGPRRIDEQGNQVAAGVWGDYFSIRPHGSRQSSWVTVGYTIRSRPKESLKAESEYIEFHSDTPDGAQLAESE